MTGDTQLGRMPTPEEQQYAAAAASLTPDQSLQRIDDLAKFVFANVAVIGTVLTGFGLFTAGAQTLNRGPSLLGLPLTIMLVALSLVLAIGALFPALSHVNPGEPETVKRFFGREIPRRGILAMLSLLAFAAAVISAAAVAITDSLPAQTAPAISLQLTGTGDATALTVHAHLTGLPQGSLMTTRAVGHGRPASSTLCENVSQVDASGAAGKDCSVPAGRFRSYSVSTSVTQGSRALERHTVSLVR